MPYQGENEGNYLVHSTAKITALAFEELSESIPLSSIQTVETGNEKTVKSLYLYGLEIPLYLSAPKYLSFESNENRKLLKPNRRSLPLGIIETTYKETELQNVTYTVEEAKQILKDRISSDEQVKFDGGEVVEKEEIFSQSGNVLTLRVKYVIRKTAGVQKPIIIEK